MLSADQSRFTNKNFVNYRGNLAETNFEAACHDWSQYTEPVENILVCKSEQSRRRDQKDCVAPVFQKHESVNIFILSWDK